MILRLVNTEHTPKRVVVYPHNLPCSPTSPVQGRSPGNVISMIFHRGNIMNDGNAIGMIVALFFHVFRGDISPSIEGTS